jgi:L-ascorbate metabolism protein UlaG (beta-lactamase superfamily)
MPHLPRSLRFLDRLSSEIPSALLHREPRPPEDSALALQWLGTAGFRLLSRGHHLWFDPHLSRHSLAQLALGPIRPDIQRIVEDVDIAHAVAIGHSHFDHALDAPAIARMHGARVYGASDTLNWCRGSGVAEHQLFELRGDGEVYREGPFALRGFRSEHSPFLAGKVPFPGRIAQPFSGPAPVSAWRVGQVLTLHADSPGGSVHHVGSAALVEAELRGVQADVVMACTIGRHATPHFARRLVETLRPKLLIPCHWDRFWEPMDRPARQIPGNDLLGFLEEVAAVPGAPEVRVLPLRGWTVVRA